MCVYLLISLNKYKSSLVVSSITLTGWWLGNVFKPVRMFSYYTGVQTGLLTDTLWVDFTLRILLYVYIYFDYLIVFSTSRYSNLGSLILYFVYFTRYFYTHYSHFLFQVSASLHCYRILLLHSVVDLSDLIIIVGCCYLVNPLDKVLQNLYDYHIFDYLILRFLWCIIYFEDIRYYVCDAGYP